MNPMKTSPHTTGNFWPHAIIGWFVIFGSAMAAWVCFAVRQNMDLVRPDYYEEEIRFQKQLDTLNRTADWRGQVSLSYESARNAMTLRLPAHFVAGTPTGRIQFYRPSDATLDFERPLAIDSSGLQQIDVNGLRPGQWKIRVNWKLNGKDYLFEQTVVLDESSPVTAAKSY